MSLARLLSPDDDSRKPVSHKKMYGVAVGIVKEIKDDKNLGRVKLNFPWLAEKDAEAVAMGKNDDPAHSNWARVATWMAGAKRGAYFIPEVGDEVLVAFEHGELDRPVVLGALWNQQDAPPETMDKKGKNDIRALHTRSGHKIVFNDSEDKPSILIVDNTGENSIAIDSKQNTMAIQVKGDLKIEVGGKITITAGQDITIETQGNLKVNAQAKGALETGGPLEIKSKAKLALDGTSQAEVKAAAVSVNGSGMTEIKGGLVKIN
ncbi:MAG: phage baseplate assembly protein V [Caldilineaceae bacterium]